MKILILDDHPLYSDGLQQFLNEIVDNAETKKTSTADSALQLIDTTQFDVAFIDFRLADINGLDILKAILERNPAMTVAIISGIEEPSLAKRAIDMGACGFIPKSLSPDDFKQALVTVLQGLEYLTPKMRIQVDQLNRLALNQFRKAKSTSSEYGITARQMEVLSILIDGHSNKRISQILNISPETVKEHVHNLFLALDVNNRMACAVRARALGLDTQLSESRDTAYPTP